MTLVATTDFSAEISALRATLSTISAVSDPEALRARIEDLSQQATAPDLWDDTDKAQKVTTALSQAQNKLERITSMESRIDDLEVLVEMATEGAGVDAAETLAEAEAELLTIRKDLDQLASPGRGRVHPQYVARLLDELADDDVVFLPDVGSPVVARATTPAAPASRQSATSCSRASRATAPRASNGVTRAT